MTHPSEMDVRFEQAMGAWDDHVQSCQACLAHGRNLCQEGVLVAYDVSRARIQIETFEQRQSRTLFDAVRRIGLPGVPA